MTVPPVPAGVPSGYGPARAPGLQRLRDQRVPGLYQPHHPVPVAGGQLGYHTSRQYQESRQIHHITSLFRNTRVKPGLCATNSDYFPVMAFRSSGVQIPTVFQDFPYNIFDYFVLKCHIKC